MIFSPQIHSGEPSAENVERRDGWEELIRSSAGKPSQRKRGSRTFGEGVQNWLRNALLLVNDIQNP